MSEIKLNRIYRVKNHVMATKQAECIIPLSLEKNHWDGYSANYLLYKYYSVRCGKISDLPIRGVDIISVYDLVE